MAAPGQQFDGLVLAPITQRDGATIVSRRLQQHMNSVAGEKIVVFELPSLPGASGLPVQFVIKTTEPSVRLNEVSRAFLDEVNHSGRFMFFDTDLKYDLPQSVIEIDREKTAQLGLTMTQVGSALGSLLGGGYVNYFSMQTRSYRVIPQVQRVSRLNVDQLLDYPIANLGGVPVPLSTIARIRTETVPETLNHFQQLNSATLSGRRLARLLRRPRPSTICAVVAARTLPIGYTIDYAGPSRQFVQESTGVLGTFGFAIVIAFLTLAALYESFRDPLVILISVPLSIAGRAHLHRARGARRLAQYLHPGGPRDPDRPHQQAWHPDRRSRERGTAQRQEQARRHRRPPPSVRLRPILMTTAAMVLGRDAAGVRPAGKAALRVTPSGS